MADRFKVYKFFAHLFAYPEREESFFSTLESFYPYGDKTPFQELKKLPFEELQAEYTSLFVANFKGVPCKPYQSFFTAEKTLMGGPAFETAKFYELFGLSVPENDMPDFVPFQLDFAAFLVKAIENSTNAQEKKQLLALYKAFFKRHLLWMERFADCVAENTTMEPLKELTEKFKEFLREEKTNLRL